jgi:hypothetical protein
MPTPATIWLAVIVLAAVLFVVKEVFKRPQNNVTHLSHKIKHILTLGPSRDEFFCPGDKEAWEDGEDNE